MRQITSPFCVKQLTDSLYIYLVFSYFESSFVSDVRHLSYVGHLFLLLGHVEELRDETASSLFKPQKVKNFESYSTSPYI